MGMYPGFVSGPHGARNYWKSQFFAELSDEAIETLVEKTESLPTKE